MKKYRIVELKDANGKSIFKIQQKFLWVFWVGEIHPEGYSATKYKTMEEAQGVINSWQTTKIIHQ